MTRTLPDLSASVFGIVLASAYVWQAGAIEDSLLADEVGARGVPVGIGLLMLAASFALLIKCLLARSGQTQPPAESLPPSAADGSTGTRPHERPHRMALGLLLILAAYVALLPWAGYIMSIGLLVAAVALFAGARMAPVLVAFSLLTGPVLWFLFQYLLQVGMPAGAWSVLFGG